MFFPQFFKNREFRKSLVYFFATLILLGIYVLPVVVFAAAGSLDTNFGNDGIVTTNVFSSYEEGKAIAIQSDGKIVVAGSSNSDFGLVRFEPDGSKVIFNYRRRRS